MCWEADSTLSAVQTLCRQSPAFSASWKLFPALLTPRHVSVDSWWTSADRKKHGTVSLLPVALIAGGADSPDSQAFYLQSRHVLQHHITNPLIIAFDMSIWTPLPVKKNRLQSSDTKIFSAFSHTQTARQDLPQSQPLVQLLQEASVELIDRVDVGKEEGHQTLRHGIFFDHSTSEPLKAAKPQSVDLLLQLKRRIGELKL